MFFFNLNDFGKFDVWEISSIPIIIIIIWKVMLFVVVEKVFLINRRDTVHRLNSFLHFWPPFSNKLIWHVLFIKDKALKLAVTRLIFNSERFPKQIPPLFNTLMFWHVLLKAWKLFQCILFGENVGSQLKGIFQFD